MRGLSRDHSFYFHQIKGKLKTQLHNSTQDESTGSAPIQIEAPSLQLKRLTLSPEQQQEEAESGGEVSSVPSIVRGYESEKVSTVEGRAEVES